MSSTNSAYVYAGKSLALFVVCMGLNAYERPSFANDRIQTPAALQREAVTVGDGDGSSFEQAIMIHAAKPQTAALTPSLNEETPEWRRRIKSQDVESIESAETLAVAFNSAKLAAGPRGAGEADDTKDLSTAIACLKPQDLPFKEKDLLGYWRCRSIQASDLLVIAYPLFKCRFIQKDGKLFFEKTTGSQRRSGYLYPSAGDHMVFLGSLTMNDDANSGEYTNTVGVLVRKASDRFLLVLDATQKGYEIYEIVK